MKIHFDPDHKTLLITSNVRQIGRTIHLNRLEVDQIAEAQDPCIVPRIDAFLRQLRAMEAAGHAQAHREALGKNTREGDFAHFNPRIHDRVNPQGVRVVTRRDPNTTTTKRVWINWKGDRITTTTTCTRVRFVEKAGTFTPK